MSNSNKTTPAFTIIGNWATRSRLLKSEYTQLTDDDLKFELGKEEELIAKFETRLNKSREQIIEILQKGQPATV
jgi:uncharacterized protein YjbJ (UPF0337 family)